MSAQEILKETGTRKDASMRHFTGTLSILHLPWGRRGFD